MSVSSINTLKVLKVKRVWRLVVCLFVWLFFLKKSILLFLSAKMDKLENSLGYFDCSICFEDTLKPLKRTNQLQELVKIPKCNHIFHKTCFQGETLCLLVMEYVLVCGLSKKQCSLRWQNAFH